MSMDKHIDERLYPNGKPGQDPSTSKEHRRRGGAFDELARVLRRIEVAVFKNGSVIADRPGTQKPSDVTNPATFVKALSVFEIFQQREPKSDSFNLFYLGRKGTGEKLNTNYVEIAANSRLAADVNQSNGQIAIILRRDGTQIAALQLVDLEKSPGLTANNGGRFFISGGGGDEGGVQISALDADGNIEFALVVDGAGIQMYGLPTSSSGLASGAIWRDAASGNVLKIVP